MKRKKWKGKNYFTRKKYNFKRIELLDYEHDDKNTVKLHNFMIMKV